MKEYPVLMTDEMIRAILAGRKTQSRRPVKPQPTEPLIHAANGNWRYTDREGIRSDSPVFNSPFGIPGDMLWFREACRAIELENGDDVVEYRADRTQGQPQPNNGYGTSIWIDMYHYRGGLGQWVPNIHMPRWVARLFGKTVNVRIERLRDISATDVVAEGLRNTGDGWGPLGRLGSVAGFLDYWDSFYATKGFGTDVNPYVWVGEFKSKEDE